MPETIQSYLETVQEQIRWKRARPVLARELARHLEDQRDDFIKEGRPEDEAVRLAIQDMGDPVEVGAELDRVHRPRPQWGLLGLTFILALVGVFLRVSLSIGRGWGERYLLINALLSLALGTGALLGAYFLDISRLARCARVVYVGALAAGILSLLLSPTAGGGVSYYTRYVVQFYPVAYAAWLYSFRGTGWRGLGFTVLGGVPLAAVCCMAPYMTALLTLLLAGLVLTLHAAWQDWFGIGRRKGPGAVLAVAFSLPACLVLMGYGNSLLERLQIALHPELDPQGKGYMGWMLHMFWEGIPPLRRHPSAGIRVSTVGANDFSGDFLPVSAAVRWGWLPLLLVISALAVLLAWLLVKGLRQKHCLGRLVVLAVALTLGSQLLLSVILNLGFVLFSASLPLVVGNLQTVIDMALIGLALSVFRGESISQEEPVLLRQLPRIRIRIEYQ